MDVGEDGDSQAVEPPRPLGELGIMVASRQRARLDDEAPYASRATAASDQQETGENGTA